MKIKLLTNKQIKSLPTTTAATVYMKTEGETVTVEPDVKDERGIRWYKVDNGAYISAKGTEEIKEPKITKSRKDETGE